MNLWECPKCGYKIEQPETVTEVAHLCGLGKRSQGLTLVVPPEPEPEPERQDPRAAIVAASTARFPEEACGLILAGGVMVYADNVAEDPTEAFQVDPDVVDIWWPTGQIIGVWHSHCFDPAIPSERDRDFAHEGLECWIYSVMDEQLGIYRPDDDGVLQMVSIEDVVT